LDDNRRLFYEGGEAENMTKVGCWVLAVLVIVLCVSGWFLYQADSENKNLHAKNEQLSIELAEAKISLDALIAKNEMLEKKSVEGLLRETNKVVVSGWETLLDTVEQELDKAREMIQQKNQASEDDSAPSSEESEKEVPVIIQGERT
jgi:outer membrane murein-binding lipoprotein Lpp